LNAAEKIHFVWWANLSIFVCTFSLLLLFDHLGRPDTAMPIVDSIFVLGVLIRLNWKLRRQRWFWITLAILVAVHVLLVIFLPWDERFSKRGPNTGIITLDSCAVFVVFSVVRQFVQGRNARKQEPPQTMI